MSSHGACQHGVAWMACTTLSMANAVVCVLNVSVGNWTWAAACFACVFGCRFAARLWEEE